MSGMANHEKRRQEDAKKKAKSNTRAKSGAGSKSAGRSRAARRAGASDSPCPVDARCGGCKNLCVPYTKQLIDKQLRIERLFAPLAPDGTISLIKGMKDPYHYRNKVISPFAPGKKLPPRGQGRKAIDPHNRKAADVRGAKGGKGKRPQARYEILTGMYAAGSHELVPTDKCLIENETAKKVVLAVRDIMRKHDVAPYREDTGTGFMRHVVVRVGHTSGEVLVTLVTNSDDFPSSKSFCRELIRLCPAVTTVVQNVNERQTNVILGDKERVLYGPGFILDELCGLSFRISSKSFYQVNATQTEVLYRAAMDLAGFDGTQVAIDAYCGTGTIGLVAAKSGAARVLGVDSVRGRTPATMMSRTRSSSPAMPPTSCASLRRRVCSVRNRRKKAPRRAGLSCLWTRRARARRRSFCAQRRHSPRSGLSTSPATRQRWYGTCSS